MTGSPAVMLGTPASPLDIPLRPAASPSASPLHCGVLSGRLLCPCSPNHQHVPQTSSIIGNQPAWAQAAFILPAYKVFRSFSLQRPHFLSHYLPHRQPSLPQKQDFFFFFMVPFIYRLCFFLALAPFQKSREAKAGKQCHSLNSSKMLTTHPKSSQLAPQSSWDSTFQHQPAPLQIEVGPLQPRNEPDLVKG